MRSSALLRLTRRPIGSLYLWGLLCVPAAATAPCVAAENDGYTLSSRDEISADSAAVPCNNPERLEAVKTLFGRRGASAAEISVERFDKAENLTVRKRGSSEEIIVIGAHYDKVPSGCGAVDNWSGIVALAHLYKTLRNAALNKTILFVAFGNEEEGLLGSRAMVQGIAQTQVDHYCAMINIDSLGMGAPQVAENISSKSLLELAAGHADRMKVPFAKGTIPGADADSTSFRERNIPAITLHGLTDDYRSVLHSARDQPEILNPESIYLGYRLALALLSSVDAAECKAWR
ncbi:MAG: M20/M25/M40 family metallo-hydrolase [Acidobacteria bacterium]|nr:M20/M25/M40 family metallo-hydrolase [Acidobacteriota bacterium]